MSDLISDPPAPNMNCIHGRQRSICAICAPAADAEYVQSSSAEPAPPTGKFRKKPTLIDAVRFTGDNSDECRAFAPDMCDVQTDSRGPYLIVKTKNGYVVAAVGDMLCRQTVNGKPDYWPCAADIFEATYDAA